MGSQRYCKGIAKILGNPSVVSQKLLMTQNVRPLPSCNGKALTSILMLKLSTRRLLFGLFAASSCARNGCSCWPQWPTSLPGIRYLLQFLLVGSLMQLSRRVLPCQLLSLFVQVDSSTAASLCLAVQLLGLFIGHFMARSILLQTFSAAAFRD